MRLQAVLIIRPENKTQKADTQRGRSAVNVFYLSIRRERSESHLCSSFLPHSTHRFNREWLGIECISYTRPGGKTGEHRLSLQCILNTLLWKWECEVDMCAKVTDTQKKKTANRERNGHRFFNLTLLISLVSTVVVSCSICSRRADWRRGAAPLLSVFRKWSVTRGDCIFRKKGLQQTSDGFRRQE